MEDSDNVYGAALRSGGGRVRAVTATVVHPHHHHHHHHHHHQMLHAIPLSSVAKYGLRSCQGACTLSHIQCRSCEWTPDRRTCSSDSCQRHLHLRTSATCSHLLNWSSCFTVVLRFEQNALHGEREKLTSNVLRNK